MVARQLRIKSARHDSHGKEFRDPSRTLGFNDLRPVQASAQPPGDVDVATRTHRSPNKMQAEVRS
jgi:hypothetical protein